MINYITQPGGLLVWGFGISEMAFYWELGMAAMGYPEMKDQAMVHGRQASSRLDKETIPTLSGCFAFFF